MICDHIAIHKFEDGRTQCKDCLRIWPASNTTTLTERIRTAKDWVHDLWFCRTKPEVRDYLEHIVIPEVKAEALREAAAKFKLHGDIDVGDLLLVEANALAPPHSAPEKDDGR